MPNSKKRNHRNSRKALLTVPALAITSALLLGVATDRISSTDAAWTDHEFTQTTLSAANLGTFTQMTCQDSGLLGGLISDRVVLNWAPPSGAESFAEGSIKYAVSWGSTISIGLDTDSSDIVDGNTYTYKPSGVLKAGVTTTVKITPYLDGTDWVSDTIEVELLEVSLLRLGVVLTCVTHEA